MNRMICGLAVPAAIWACLAAICAIQDCRPQCERCGGRDVRYKSRTALTHSLYFCNGCHFLFRYDDGEFSCSDAFVACTRADSAAYPPTRPSSRTGSECTR